MATKTQTLDIESLKEKTIRQLHSIAKKEGLNEYTDLSAEDLIVRITENQTMKNSTQEVSMEEVKQEKVEKPKKFQLLDKGNRNKIIQSNNNVENKVENISPSIYKKTETPNPTFTQEGEGSQEKKKRKRLKIKAVPIIETNPNTAISIELEVSPTNKQEKQINIISPYIEEKNQLPIENKTEEKVSPIPHIKGRTTK
jgi:hypothetical protein